MAAGLAFLTQALLSKLTPESETNDPRIWLEDVLDEDCLEWVKTQNKASCAAIGEPQPGHALFDRFLAIMDSKAKIPYVQKINDHFYNFWQDAEHKRGILRRTTLAEYTNGDACAWETVLDLDALGAEEGENWVWKGKTILDLGPGTERDLVLIKLSRGGADASVLREFSLKTKSFVTEQPFNVPEAKTSAGYLDAHTLLIGTDFGAGSLTASGYPRQVKRWRRGTPLAQAELVLVFEGQESDVSVSGWFYFDHDIKYEMLHRSTTFYTSKQYIKQGADFVEIAVPEDMRVSTFRDQFIFHPRSAWTVSGSEHEAGSLLSIPVAEFLAGNFSHVTVLFAPTATASLDSYSATCNYLILSVLDNVLEKHRLWEYAAGAWVDTGRVIQFPNMATAHLSAVDADVSDEIWVTSSGFTEPTTLSLGSAADAATSARRLRSLPAFFNATGVVVQQFEATSLDGTKIPYFQVSRGDLPLNGTTPTLLYGYGGFEISLLPYYSATLGSAWLEPGYCYVQANIRGGGEFGPKWHQAALKAQRHKAYEDFIAVAEHLISRGVTAPKHLGIQGGSNGGLLVGNMLTMRPDLWGAVLCQVPLLDMFRYTKLLAGASWIAEYGDPEQPDQWAFLRQYSPYHNVAANPAHYPALLVTTSTRDDRVHPGHARKLVKKLLDRGHTRTLYYENIEGGHGGAADNKQRAFMTCLGYEFLAQNLGGKSFKSSANL